MRSDRTTLEHAFALARSGKYRDVKWIKRALTKEGYNAAQIEGRIIAKQLRAIIKAATDSADRPAHAIILELQRDLNVARTS
jgi:hypothetical protein